MNMNAPDKATGSSNPIDRIPPYRIVPDFLGNDMIKRLLEHVSARQDEFVPTAVWGNDGEAHIDPEIRVSRVLRDFGDLHDEVNARFRAVMSQAVADLRLNPFELHRCEIELVAHNDGAFFRRHLDTKTGTTENKSQRVLTGVLYFHSLPKGFSGGQIRLYSFMGEDFVDIEPERDRLVLFPAWAPHEVLPIACPSGEFSQSRFAINCWYRRPSPHRHG